MPNFHHLYEKRKISARGLKKQPEKWVAVGCTVWIWWNGREMGPIGDIFPTVKDSPHLAKERNYIKINVAFPDATALLYQLPRRVKFGRRSWNSETPHCIQLCLNCTVWAECSSAISQPRSQSLSSPPQPPAAKLLEIFRTQATVHLLFNRQGTHKTLLSWIWVGYRA